MPEYTVTLDERCPHGKGNRRQCREQVHAHSRSLQRHLREEVEAVGGTLVVPYETLYSCLARLTEEQAWRLKERRPEWNVDADDSVTLEFEQPVVLGTTDPAELSEDELWHLRATAGLRADPQADGGAGVKVTVLDTGIDGHHPELDGKVSQSWAYQVDMDTRQPVPAGGPVQNAHGTNVASLIAGSTLGAAPGCTLIDGRMVPDGTGRWSHFFTALWWASQDPDVAVINISAGIPTRDKRLLRPIRTLSGLGVVVVVAAGNQPDAADCPANFRETVAIGAAGRKSAQEYNVWARSGRQVIGDYTVPDLVAPGVKVTVADLNPVTREFRYATSQGTSMAAPIVSGAAALLAAKHPTWTAPQIREALMESTLDLQLPTLDQGAGLLMA